jgi:hypothetical protein
MHGSDLPFLDLRATTEKLRGPVVSLMAIRIR